MNYASHFISGLYFLFATLFPLQSFADSGAYQEITSSRDTQQALWLIEQKNAVASLILFAGGKGKLKIDSSGIGKPNNFLVRTRQTFAEHGFNVAVIDKPNDKSNLYGFRTTQGHAQDIQAVISFLRKKYKKPVWLIGTSRGTLSVANAAARLSGANGPDGIVLSASVVVSKKRESLNDVGLGDIRVPSLFVHNKDDGCHVCPYADVDGVMAKMTKVKDKSLQTYQGGQSEQSNQCEALTPHGFLGLEGKVVKGIVDWIKPRL